MQPKILFCLEEEFLHNPDILGLEGENLESYPWLTLCTNPDLARKLWNENAEIKELWVHSCSPVDPINLAASLKADRPAAWVSLITFTPDGSLYSRACNANLDELLNRSELIRRFAQMKGEQAQTVTAINASGDRVGVKKKGMLLSVVSGSGGAGKSTISALSAHKASKAGMKTLLLDADFQFGDMKEVSNISNVVSLDNLLNSEDAINQFIAKSGALSLIEAPKRLESADEAVDKLPTLLDRLLGSFDLVVANTGSTWGEQHALLLERSSIAMFLIDQRGSSVRACKHALELCSRCGIASTPFRFVLNRCSKNATFTAIDIACALKGVQAYELKDGGSEVEDCLWGGAIDELLISSNELVKSLGNLLEKFLPLELKASNATPKALGRTPGLFRVGRQGQRRKKRTTLCR